MLHFRESFFELRRQSDRILRVGISFAVARRDGRVRSPVLGGCSLVRDDRNHWFAVRQSETPDWKHSATHILEENRPDPGSAPRSWRVFRMIHAVCGPTRFGRSDGHRRLPPRLELCRVHLGGRGARSGRRIRRNSSLAIGRDGQRIQWR